MKMPSFYLILHGALFVILTHATAVIAQDRAVPPDVNARPSSSSASPTWQSHASLELAREAALRASVRERQGRFSAARSAWEKADKAALQPRPARAADAAPGEAKVIPAPASQRGIHRAALLSVYDADNNGVLDDSELALLASDRQMMSPPASASATASRWRRLVEKIQSNPRLDEVEKKRLGDIFRHKAEPVQSEVVKEGERK